MMTIFKVLAKQLAVSLLAGKACTSDARSEQETKAMKKTPFPYNMTQDGF